VVIVSVIVVKAVVSVAGVELAEEDVVDEVVAVVELTIEMLPATFVEEPVE
jgi:hypothetical protein